MKLPKTPVIVAGLTAASAAALGWAAPTYHWLAEQTLAASTVSVATIALLGFVAAHVRKETPSRWVGVFGLLTTEVPAVAALGIAFAWWPHSANNVAGVVVAGVTIVAAGFGVSIAQAKVTSPETLSSQLTATAQEVAAAKAAVPETHAR